jgi:hypothetical protein
MVFGHIPSLRRKKNLLYQPNIQLMKIPPTNQFKHFVCFELCYYKLAIVSIIVRSGSWNKKFGEKRINKYIGYYFFRKKRVEAQKEVKQ